MSFNNFLNEIYVDKSFVKDFVNDIVGKDKVNTKQIDEWLNLANHIGIHYDDLQERSYNYLSKNFKQSNNGLYAYVQELLLEILKEKLSNSLGHNVEIKMPTNKNAELIVNGHSIKSVRDYKEMLKNI